MGICDKALGTIFSCPGQYLYIATSVPQVIQAIKPVAYSGEASYEGTLEVYDLCKLQFLYYLGNISTCNMLSIQPQTHNPE